MSLKSVFVLGALMLGAVIGEGAAEARPLPPGSYQQSCRDMAFSHGTLSAVCRTADQHERRTSLDRIAWCNGDISNNDGRLSCNRGDLPGGSYLQSCERSQMRGNTLVASCRTRRGDWHDTSLRDIHACAGDISNEDGRLSCPR